MRTTWRILMVAAAVAGVVCAVIALRNPWVTFTVQSNTVLAIYYLWLLASRRAGGPVIGGAVTLYLVVTGVVAFFALPLPDLGGGIRHVGNVLLHCVTPVMALVDWLAFRRARRPGWGDPLKWLAFPLFYAAVVLVAAPSLPIRMARRHLGLDDVGVGDYVLAGLAFSVVFVAAGYALVGLHRSVLPGKGAHEGRIHHAGKDDRVSGRP